MTNNAVPGCATNFYPFQFNNPTANLVYDDVGSVDNHNGSKMVLVSSDAMYRLENIMYQLSKNLDNLKIENEKLFKAINELSAGTNMRI